MIILETIRWKNFLSTGNIFTEVSLNTNKTTLICGENGSGKSTIMDAITFALFNKPFRKINKPQLINAITDKNCLVEIEFSINKTKYKVVRGLKKNIFEIYKNGNMINQSADNRDYQDILERNILKINYKTFCQIVILGSANWTAFMELAPGIRRKVIEDLLDIQVFSVMNILLKEKLNKNKDSSEQLDKAIAILENTISLNTAHRKKLQRMRVESIDKKQTDINEYNKELDILFEKRDKLEIAQNSLDKLNTELYNLESEHSNQEYKIQKLDNSIVLLNKEIQRLENESVCPTCLQELDETKKTKNIKSIKKSISDTEKSIKKEQPILDNLFEKIEQLNTKLDKFHEVNKCLNKVNSEITLKQQFVISIQKEINEMQQPVEEEIDVTKEKSNLKTLQKHKEKIINNKEIFNMAGLLLKDTGIKTQIIRQYIPVMNKLINYYLEKMEFFCQFNIDENFNEQILARHRDNFSYASFSQGEKMRVDLALLFTWREISRLRNSSTINLLLLDEIMDSSLDSNGTEEFINIISKLTGNNNVIIISHKADQISDKFDNSIYFEKVKNFSRIKERV